VSKAEGWGSETTPFQGKRSSYKILEKIKEFGHIHLRKIRQMRVKLIVGISPNRLGDATFQKGWSDPTFFHFSHIEAPLKPANPML